MATTATPASCSSGRTGLTFDPLAPAEAATQLVLDFVLHPERASRLEAQRALDTSLPGLGEVVDALVDDTWKNKTLTRESYQAAIRRQTEGMIVQGLMNLAASEDASPAARSMALFKLNDLKTWMDQKQFSVDEQHRAHYFYTLRRIEQFEKGDKEGLAATKLNSVPDGSPIDPGQDWLEPVCGW